MRVIAIDGPAGSGKSTVARRLAERLQLQYLDTGAMYRAVTFAALRRGIDPADVEDVARLVSSLELVVGVDTITVDGVDASIEIRGPEVTRAVSIVAANPHVRSELRRRQQEWAVAHGGGVIEGRDIGSVVFPDAELKVYLTAAPDVRAGRRAKEVSDLDYEQVAADIAKRDALDQGRTDSPLTQVDGALEVDTSHLGVDEIVDLLERRLEPPPEPGLAPESAVSAESGRTSEPAVRAEGGPAASERASTGPHGPSVGERLLYSGIRAVLVGFARVYFRLRVEGLDNVPADGPFILSPIHRSNIDFLVVLVCAKRRMRYMAKDTLWKPGVGRLWGALGGIPVHRGSADREALRTSIEVIESGEPLVMFPEGTRQTGPEIAPLFDGPAYVQARTGAPIVPVGIGGTEAVMPKGGKMLRPHKVVVVIGPALAAPQVEGAKARRSSVKAQTARLSGEVQRLFDRAQEATGTPNR